MALVDSGAGHSGRAWAEHAVVHDALRRFRVPALARSASTRSNKRRRVGPSQQGAQLVPSSALVLKTHIVVARAGSQFYRILPSEV